jgi:hypothetical protein
MSPATYVITRTRQVPGVRGELLSDTRTVAETTDLDEVPELVREAGGGELPDGWRERIADRKTVYASRNDVEVESE